jgi:uncharacterized protein (DUF1330 family)
MLTRRPEEQQTMKTYLIADIEVLDANVYADYIKAAQPIVLEHGGRYLVRGGKAVPMAGDWNPTRMLVIEFDSLVQLRSCFSCEAYQRVAPLRLASTRSRSVVVEGVPETN